VLDELGAAAAGTPGRLPRRPWPPGASRAARTMLALLVDGQVLGPSPLTGLPAAAAGATVVELELAGFVRRLPGGVQAVALQRDG